MSSVWNRLTFIHPENQSIRLEFRRDLNEMYRFGVIHKERVKIIERREYRVKEARVKEKKVYTHIHTHRREGKKHEACC